MSVAAGGSYGSMARNGDESRDTNGKAAKLMADDVLTQGSDYNSARSRHRGSINFFFLPP